MGSEGKGKPTESHPRFVYISTIFASTLALLVGYAFGIISGAMLLLVDTFQLDTMWQQLIATFGTVGAALALPLAGYLVQILGRKKMILGSNTLMSVGAIITAAAPTKEVVLVGRLFAGMGAGNCTYSGIPNKQIEYAQIFNLKPVSKEYWKCD